ncbi:MAG: hypothetical protein ACREMS_05010 [Gemmatimonadaceae bacterium]
MRNLAARLSFVVAGLSGVACRTLPTTGFSTEDLGLIRADSEVFEAVVVPHPALETKPFLFTPISARFDARPYGRQTSFPIAAGGSIGGSPSLFVAPDSSTIARMISVRREVLKRNGLTEGGPLSFQQCAGTLMPYPVPGSAPTRSVYPRAGCPKKPVRYISVGIPVRGEPEELRQMRRSDQKPVDPSQVAWSVLVEDATAGSAGQNWHRLVWLLTRNPSTHRLEVAQTILIAWAE